MNKAKLFNDNEKKLLQRLEFIKTAKEQFSGSNSPLDQKNALLALQGELEALELIIDIQLIKYKEV